MKTANEAGSESKLEETGNRAPYTAPKLSEFGTVASHVRGTGSAANEGAPGGARMVGM